MSTVLDVLIMGGFVFAILGVTFERLTALAVLGVAMLAFGGIYASVTGLGAN